MPQHLPTRCLGHAEEQQPDCHINYQGKGKGTPHPCVSAALVSAFCCSSVLGRLGCCRRRCRCCCAACAGGRGCACVRLGAIQLCQQRLQVLVLLLGRLRRKQKTYSSAAQGCSR
jgi:hypothetical protein